MVLYRKYRPQKFEDVVGQEHIKKTLTNSLAQGTFSHGYLFSGPRGSGKTTAARIFAKALNCTGRKLGKDSFEPCNKCSSCQEINDGKSLDIIEIDAASNRGIDEIRELREKIRFAPTSSTYKVYIIDEVHMLTKEAFNALLKTLEEPPKHAIFIMATTESHKVLPTILSRVQRFDFHKATVEEVTFLIEKIAKIEKILIDKNAVTLLGQMSFGAYRDALSLLDQVSSTMPRGEKITIEHVQEMLGLAQEESIFEFIGLLLRRKREDLFGLISKLYFQGIDWENFSNKLVEVLRRIALFKMGENQLFDLTKEQQEKAISLSKEFEIGELMALIESISTSVSKIKNSHFPQLPLEMIVFDFTLSGAEKSSNGPTIIEEAKPKESVKADSEMNKAQIKAEPKPQTEEIIEERKPVDNIKPVAGIFDKNLWPEVVKAAKGHNHAFSATLSNGVISQVEGENITIAFKFKFHSDMISKNKNTQLVEEIIEKITGSKYIINCIVNKDLKIQAPVEDEEMLLNGAKEVFGIEE